MWAPCRQGTLFGCLLLDLHSWNCPSWGNREWRKDRHTETLTNEAGRELCRRHSSSSLETLFILHIEINEAGFCIQLNEEAGLQCAAKQGGRFTQAQVQVFIREQSQAVSNPEKQAAIYIFYTHCQYPHTTGGRFCHFPEPDAEQALPCPRVWGTGLCFNHPRLLKISPTWHIFYTVPLFGSLALVWDVWGSGFDSHRSFLPKIISGCLLPLCPVAIIIL